MTFDESKHARGGEGTKEGGKFVAKGQGGTPTGDEPPPLPRQAATGQVKPEAAAGKPAGDSDAKIAKKVNASVERHRPYMSDDAQAEKFRSMLMSSEKSKAAKRVANAANKEALVLMKYASAEQDLAKKGVLLQQAETAVKAATAEMDKYAKTVHEFIAVRDVYFKHKSGASVKPDGQGAPVAAAAGAQKEGGA